MAKLKDPKKEKSKFKFDPENDPLILRTGNERMMAAKEMEIPNMLFGELIFERTVIMLFSETGLGKTLLAFQLVDALSRGESILELENEAGALTTLYVDMENGESVFQSRYSESRKRPDGKKEYFNEYDWNENCHFLDLNDPEKYEVPKKDAIEWWFELIKYKADKCNAKVIVIDNLFSIINEGGVESTKEVAPILRELLKLKKSKGWTVIVVHHTPKRQHGAINRNDVSGSSNLTNLVDGVIGIGISNYDGDEHSRYIKQVKPTRFSAVKYGETNVITCKTDKLQPNFTGFKRINLDEDQLGYRYENTHLGAMDTPTGKEFTDEERKKRQEIIKNLIVANPDVSKTEIAEYAGISRPTVYKDLEKIEKENGQLFNNDGK